MRANFKAMIQQAKREAFEEGVVAGRSRAMRHMSDEPMLSLKVENPYSKHLCKHCGHEISGGVHETGKSQYLMRCNPEDTMLPYGLIAEHVDDPCTNPCTGTVKIHPRD